MFAPDVPFPESVADAPQVPADVLAVVNGPCHAPISKSPTAGVTFGVAGLVPVAPEVRTPDV